MNIRKFINRVLLLCFLLLFFSFDAIPNQEIISRKIKIGVLAKRGPERCLSKWESTATYLNENISGYTFEIVPLGYNEIFPSVKNAKVDFILANSSFYVELEMQLGVQRMVTLNNLHLGRPYTVYGGVIFCRADRDDIKTIQDLKGKRFISLDEKAFASWVTVLREMKENGVDPYSDFAKLEFRGPMDEVVLAVRNGEADAGSVRTDLLEQMAQEGKIRLEEFFIINLYSKKNKEIEFLHSTQMYPEWPLAKVKHVSDDLAEQVAVALIQMPSNSEAAVAARCAGWTIPLNYQPVHDCLKFLKISPYEEYGEITIRDFLSQYGYWAAGFLGLIFTVFIAYLVKINNRLKVSLVKQEKEIEVRKIAENTLDQSLKEKEILLREVYHRTKNNMQVITSMINLQAKATQNKEIMDILREITTRINSMAIVHSYLYKSEDLSRINLKDYLEELSTNLFKAFDVHTGKIKINYFTEDVMVKIDSAVPCGLVLNEIITNSLKHAFPDYREGEITIDLKQSDNKLITLKIKDNGVGMPENIDFLNAKTLGLQLLHGLTTKQLDGKIKLQNENGVYYKIEFIEPVYAERI